MTDLVERLRSKEINAGLCGEAADEIERLQAVIVRAKDALLDGQSTQWVHDLLVGSMLGPKP
jgi:hypothetical protein